MDLLRYKWIIPCVLIYLFIIMAICCNVRAETITLTASWYSLESLKKEGTYAYSHGRMANGETFLEDELTCACRLYPLGTRLKITSIKTGKSVYVWVTDRIGKRFATSRIDLSKYAFSRIADLKQGIIKIKVEEVK